MRYKTNREISDEFLEENRRDKERKKREGSVTRYSYKQNKVVTDYGDDAREHLRNPGADKAPTADFNGVRYTGEDIGTKRIKKNNTQRILENAFRDSRKNKNRK